jgi:hypothetical protein
MLCRKQNAIISYQIARSKQREKPMMNENYNRSPWAFVVLLFGGAAWAQVPFSVEQAGMGGAGVARTDSSGFRNGAAMMLEPGFFSYSELNWGQGFSLGQAVREVQTDTSVGSSFGYSWGKSDLPPTLDEMPGWVLPGEVLSNARERKEFRGASGIRLLNGRLGLGVGGRYWRDDSELGGLETDFQFDLSAAGQLAEGVTLAAGANNLLQDSTEPMRLELGLWWSAVEAFKFALDAVYEEGRVGGRAGAELGLGPAIRLRGGYHFSEVSQSLGAGIGLLGEGTRIDYALSLETFGADKGIMAHTLAVFIAVPSRQ